MSYAVCFESVSKVYRVGTYRSSVREILSRHLESSSNNAPNRLKVLDNVTFKIKAGESVGLIGHNGAGKTTTLKLLSRVARQTSGTISVSGRLSALIQLGAGFHPDLSGRDNIFLNGSILGLSRAEIRKRFDEIVSFAELDQFIETPVKRYSSGMYARLGFSVAIHVHPEVLLVDEVLAVGDTAFQYKCFRKIREFVDAGGTVIFVSHNLDAVQGLCQRALWLDHGQLKDDGSPAKVITAYLLSQEEQFLNSGIERKNLKGECLEIKQVVLRNGAGIVTNEFASGEAIVVELHYQAHGIVNKPYFSVGVSDQGSGILFLATMLLDNWSRVDLTGEGVVTCRFTGISLMPKAYQVWGSVRDEHGFSDLVGWQPIGSFRIATLPAPIAPNAEQASVHHLKSDAPVFVNHEWCMAANP